MPSCEVYIRRIGYDREISYNDLSNDGIEGNKKGHAVASVSFSNDNSKLMMAGRDGVVIIRNLHLQEDFPEDGFVKGYFFWGGIKVEIDENLGYVSHDDEPSWLRNIENTELKDAYIDEYGVKYSKDRTVLIDCNCQMDRYVIPATVHEIREKAFFTAKIDTVVLPWTINKIGYRALFSYGIKNIECSNCNNSFMSWKGVLYTKDMKTLVAYPIGRRDALYRLPQRTLNAAKGVFSNNEDTVNLFMVHSVMPSGDDIYDEVGFCSEREVSFLEENQPKIKYPYVLITPNKSETFEADVVSRYPCFIDEKGVVYDYEKKKLVFFSPFFDMTEYAIIDGCETILENALPDFCYFDPQTQGGEVINNRLEQISLPSSISKIMGNSFRNCPNLKTIYIPYGTNEKFQSILPHNGNIKIKEVRIKEDKQVIRNSITSSGKNTITPQEKEQQEIVSPKSQR